MIAYRKRHWEDNNNSINDATSRSRSKETISESGRNNSNSNSSKKRIHTNFGFSFSGKLWTSAVHLNYSSFAVFFGYVQILAQFIIFWGDSTGEVKKLSVVFWVNILLVDVIMFGVLSRNQCLRCGSICFVADNAWIMVAS